MHMMIVRMLLCAAVTVRSKTAHHDEDDNGKVTKNWTSIFPAEGSGVSAEAKMDFGLPSFATTSISMLYP